MCVSTWADDPPHTHTTPSTLTHITTYLKDDLANSDILIYKYFSFDFSIAETRIQTTKICAIGSMSLFKM